MKRQSASRMVVINGLATTAGSKPIFLMSIGSIHPMTFAHITVSTSVSDTTRDTIIVTSSLCKSIWSTRIIFTKFAAPSTAPQRIETRDSLNITLKISLNSISLSDPKTFSIIGRGDTLGVFQLESAGMTNLVRKLKPSIFEEIAMAIALFRPGPMENSPKCLENHEHPESVT